MDIKYIVIMERWGNDENHSYPVGVFDNEDSARYAGLANEYYRGGKYEAHIFKVIENLTEDQDDVLAWFETKCGGLKDDENYNQKKLMKIKMTEFKT